MTSRIHLLTLQLYLITTLYSFSLQNCCSKYMYTAYEYDGLLVEQSQSRMLMF